MDTIIGKLRSCIVIVANSENHVDLRSRSSDKFTANTKNEKHMSKLVVYPRYEENSILLLVLDAVL